MKYPQSNEAPKRARHRRGEARAPLLALAIVAAIVALVYVIQHTL